MSVLNGLKPQKVFEYFEKISAVPRGSGKTEKITEFCVDFAEKRGFRYLSDKTGNVVIFKNGSAGRENEEPVILQGHTDMVWEKAENSTFDFENSPLELKTDGEWVWANGTTLGGDDGIAVAMCMALLESEDISHPPLEVVFTVDEETGMGGAKGLDCSALKGKRMINLDSEDERTLWAGCAGSARVDVLLDGKTIPASGKPFKLKVSGLHGGHSGAEIHKGYANASKVLGKVLGAIAENEELMIESVNGGTMDNAITRESKCDFYLLTDERDLNKTVDEWRKKLGIMLSLTDPGFTLTLEEREGGGRAFNASSTAKIIGLLCELPSGVVAMSEEMPELVETSLNLGITATAGNRVRFGFLVRSLKNKRRDELVKQLETIAGIYGAEFEIGSVSPAWEYNENSSLRETMKKIYPAVFGRECNVTVVHAGLECGIFCGAIDGLDCVSAGPDIVDIHTPGEKLSVDSVNRVWDYLLEVLKAL